jgi:DNA-binding response OmpR family regulator
MNSETLQTSHSINTILLAEDDLEHCFFFKKALNQVNPNIKFNEVHDGDELISLLENFIPDLLFLDLKMPCKNGIECIKEIRENKAYDTLPIIVFTMSDQENAIQTSYGFGANLYLVKPSEYALLVNSLQKILSMDWSDPKSITEKHYRGSKYVPFEAA